MEQQQHAEMKQRIGKLFYECRKTGKIHFNVSHDEMDERQHKALAEALREKKLLVERICPRCEEWDITKEVMERR